MRTRQLIAWLFTVATVIVICGGAISVAAQTPFPRPEAVLAEQGAPPPPPPAARPAQAPRPQPGPQVVVQQPGQPPPNPPQPGLAPNPIVMVNPRGEPDLAVNIKVDLTVTEQQAGAAQTPKVVSVIVADGGLGRVRSSRPQPGLSSGLNIDARPKIVEKGSKVRLALEFNYDIRGESKSPIAEPVFGGALSLQESITVILENGKPLIVSQSADPQSDRKVTVEVKATIMK